MTDPEPISPELVLVSPELRHRALRDLRESALAASANLRTGSLPPAASLQAPSSSPDASLRTAFLPEYGQVIKQPRPRDLVLAVVAYTVGSLLYALVIVTATLALVAAAVALAVAAA